MSSNRKNNFLLILIFLLVIAAFALSYNKSVSQAVSEAAERDREMLSHLNTEVIGRLTSAGSSGEWKSIIDSYDGIKITVVDENNAVIVSSDGGDTALDISVQNAFNYKQKAYIIKSKKYLLKDSENEGSVLLEFIFTEFMIGCAGLLLMIFIIYTIMLRPYKRFYRLIEEYERTGKLPENKFKGYIGHVYDRFASLTKNLERQQKNQQRIIASISHDIKTPLTSIMGYTERLKKDNISPERRARYLDTVYSKSLEIRGLVDEFDEYLGYNMSDKMDSVRLSTGQLCEQIVSEYADELENTGVRLNVINNAEKAFVTVDRPKFNRVVGNIVSNSLKHFNSDEKKISVLVTDNKNSVFIEISDNGEGVPEEKLELIFEPLYTSDEGRKVAGLGLAICREIIESHGGNIHARKSDLGGLAVCIELPRT